MTNKIDVAAMHPAIDQNSHAKQDPARVRDAAQQFESLLIAQMLKTAREADDGGWLGTGDDQAGASALDMAEEQFARLLAVRGGLGLTDMIAKGLEKAPSRPLPAGRR